VIVPAHVQALANDLTRGALAGKLSRVLADPGINEKEVALTVYQFLESLWICWRHNAAAHCTIEILVGRPLSIQDPDSPATQPISYFTLFP
jgi:hypothetical protein